ncbi:MAG TPA: ribonuclease P protein component [Leucothrix sp.]|nr:ribonuclease P protein component [Leucothrix sp.]
MNNEQRFKLPRDLKLLTVENYQDVFSKAERFGNYSFTVLARPNDLNHPRLGLAISKKCAKRAVDRNRIKRLFRESFRLNQHKLPSVDIIAMCKPSAIKLTNHEMHEQIEKQWHFMRKKFASRSD